MNEEIMKQSGFSKEVEKVNNKICPFCNKSINNKDFRNHISMKEYIISGLCQSCQDKTFGRD